MNMRRTKYRQKIHAVCGQCDVRCADYLDTDPVDTDPVDFIEDLTRAASGAKVPSASESRARDSLRLHGAPRDRRKNDDGHEAKGPGREVSRANLGIDRGPCDRCGHRKDQHVPRGDVMLCVVCDGSSQIWPCS